MGKKSRTKGSYYELYLAHLFQEYGWEDAKRHLEFQGAEAEEGRDLDNTQPWAVQAKCWATTPSITALEQVQTSAEYPLPVAILKRSKRGQKPLEVAVIPLAVFMELIATVDSGIHSRWLEPDTWQIIAGESGEAVGEDEIEP